MWGIYGLRRWDGLRCHDTPSIIKIGLIIKKWIDRNKQTAMWSHKPTFSRPVSCADTEIEVNYQNVIYIKQVYNITEMCNVMTAMKCSWT
jgi:hypothetical protein